MKNNMQKNVKRAPESLYDEFRNYFPFSTVDLLVISEDKFLLSKRLNQPYKNMWHLPGGMVRKGEKMIDTVKRIGIEELGSTPKIIKFFGTHESMSKFRHDISTCYVVSIDMKKIELENNKNLKFFTNLPKNIIPFQKLIVKNWMKEFKQKTYISKIEK
jgi:8-oxo-dGTP diphosphatase